MTAAAAVRHLIDTQHHHDPTDDEAALMERFRRREVRRDDGTVLQPTDIVPSGQFIWFYRRPAPERTVPGQLRLLYRDENILVVDKPPFMSTLPRGQHITETAVVRARRQFGIDALSPAHRLDRLTQGILLFTVRPEVRGAYQQLFEARAVQKTYEAVTPCPPGWSPGQHLVPVPKGALATDSPTGSRPLPTAREPWVLRHAMTKERGRLATYLTADTPNSETAVVGLRALSGSPDRVVWTLQPHSGRTHQLRVNMRLMGTPIINDPIYTDISDDALFDPEAELPFVPHVEDEDFSRPMGLTAQALSFTDPLSGEHRHFTSSYRY